MAAAESPLEPFFSALAGAGWRITVGEYQRVHLALQAGGPWTVNRLRNVLAALLVKDEEQESRFLRTFDSVFPLPEGGEGLVVQVPACTDRRRDASTARRMQARRLRHNPCRPAACITMSRLALPP